MPSHFLMLSLDVTLYQVSFERENAWRGTHDIKVKRKMYLQIFFPELGNKLSRLSLNQINVLEVFVLKIYSVRKVN